MSANRDFDRITSGWLAEGPTELNDRVLEAALDAIHLTHQRRRPAVPWRTPIMTTPMRLAAAIAIVAVVGFAGLTFLRGGANVGNPVPTPTCAAATFETAAPLPAPTPINPATWTRYVSDRYGFSICHPANWTAHPGDHDWSLPADSNWLNTGWDGFRSPDDSIRIVTWSVAVAPGTTVESWLQANCPTYTGPCTGLEAVSSAMSMDGHAAVLVTFKDDTQVFAVVGNRIYVVAAARPATEYDALRLVKAYASTFHLLPGGPVPVASTAPPS